MALAQTQADIVDAIAKISSLAAIRRAPAIDIDAGIDSTVLEVYKPEADPEPDRRGENQSGIV